MRSSILISVASHAALLIGAFVWLANPRPLGPAEPQAVTVDIVSPEEVKAEEEKAEKKAKEPEPVLPDFKPQPPTPPAATAAAPPPAPPEPPQAAPEPPKPQPQEVPRQPQVAAAETAQPPSPSPQPLSIFDPASIPQLLDMAGQSGGGPPSDMPANLARQEIASFKAHLRKCMRLPTALSRAQKLKVVLRVYLRPDGALNREPELLQATASPQGPLMVQTAMRALRQCQPYALPADRYQEWRVLDVSLTPAELAGG